MFEKKHHRLITNHQFLQRMSRHMLIILGFMGGSLIAGMIGYHALEGFSWLDSFLNAAMLLGGMGEIDVLKTDGGKIFAGIYSIYSGFFMIICGGLIMAPVFHRILHHFHAE
jgi:hypothetical protein